MENTEYQALQSALHLPTYEDALNVFKLIKNIDVRYKNKKTNILHYFTSIDQRNYNFRLEDFVTLIRMGTDVNAVNEVGLTPLHYCCNSHNYEAAQILVKNGAEIDKMDDMGRTPLFLAVINYRGQKELLKIILFLLSKGADLNKSNHAGKTPRDAAITTKFMVDNSPVGKKEWDLSDYIDLS